ncbi:MAG: DsbA family protein [Candidatus Aenigmarchaeota archaeon]|nr:DsbA family protein [Candidatus Aenigmarchaeota archaeon]MDW8149661.1 DsbA family protein [Candidatus Aenigmarchaeota archaeon]
MYTTFILIVMLAVSIFYSFKRTETISNATSTQQILSKEEVGKKVVDYINKNLVPPGVTIELSRVEDFDNLYKVIILAGGNEIPVYATKDGKTLFLQSFDMTVPLRREEEQQTIKLTTKLLNKINKKPFIGSMNAPITIIEFTDYQCPFCARHSKQTLPLIKANFIEKGLIKYFVFDFPLDFHQNAEEAAIASRCANEQNKYWEMHDILFEKQQEWSYSNEPYKIFKEYAASLNLDVSMFEKCIKEERYKDDVRDDYLIASENGISGTPAFFILRTNSNEAIPIRGALPYTEFERIINLLLR